MTLGVLKRIPDHTNLRSFRFRLVVPDEVAGQRLGDTELHVAVDVGVAWVEDPGNQGLVAARKMRACTCAER
jgi:hypothetical protein